VIGKSMHAGDTPNLKEAKTLLYEFSMVGDSKNAAVQESGYGYKRKSRRTGMTSAYPPAGDIPMAMSAYARLIDLPIHRAHIGGSDLS